MIEYTLIERIEPLRTHTNVENVCERKQSKNIVPETSEEVAPVWKRKYK